MTAAAILESVRESAQLTQTELARLSRVAQSNISTIESGARIPTFETLERLLRASRHTLVAVPGIGPDSSTTARRIAENLRGDSDDGALRGFIDYSDALGRVQGANRVALTLTKPASTGSPLWDAAIAALVEYQLGTGLPHPDWLREHGHELDTRTELIPSVFGADPALVPDEFLRRNVAVERAVLESV